MTPWGFSLMPAWTAWQTEVEVGLPRSLALPPRCVALEPHPQITYAVTVNKTPPRAVNLADHAAPYWMLLHTEGIFFLFYFFYRPQVDLTIWWLKLDETLDQLNAVLSYGEFDRGAGKQILHSRRYVCWMSSFHSLIRQERALKPSESLKNQFIECISVYNIFITCF